MSTMTDSRAVEVLTAMARGLPSAIAYAEKRAALNRAIARLREPAEAQALGGWTITCPECHGTGGHYWHEADWSERGERCATCHGFGYYTAPPSAPAAQGGGELVAKPLEWQEDGPGEWCDRHHGFHITQDDEEPQKGRFTAAWGECDPERFPTLDEAQAWCQEALDRYIREWAMTAPPSAPVGVEGLVTEMREAAARSPINNGVLHYWADKLEALAQQPAAVDGSVIEAARAMFDPANTWPMEARLEQLRRALATQPGGSDNGR